MSTSTNVDVQLPLHFFNLSLIGNFFTSACLEYGDLGVSGDDSINMFNLSTFLLSPEEAKYEHVSTGREQDEK